MPFYFSVGMVLHYLGMLALKFYGENILSCEEFAMFFIRIIIMRCLNLPDVETTIISDVGIVVSQDVGNS